MKTTLPLIMLACVTLAGCRAHQGQYEVVKATYMHKYGIPVTKSAWEEQGRDGQTVALRKDGVTITTTYSKGQAHGPTTYSYPNSSTVRTCETYSRGKLVSTRENYPSGVPLKEETFEDNALVNLTRWYEDGTPQVNELYQDTFLFSGEYRTPLNVVESRVEDGHGTRICRSNEGDLISRDTIHNGQMTERITYFANGDPSVITPYENGAIHGTRLTFIQGGLPSTAEQWVHGTQEGLTVVYQNGEKIAEVNFHHGKKNGIELRYRDGSILMEEVSWKDNVKHGPRKLYVDGAAKTEWYHFGDLVSRPTYERMNLPRQSA